MSVPISVSIALCQLGHKWDLRAWTTVGLDSVRGVILDAIAWAEAATARKMGALVRLCSLVVIRGGGM